MVAAAGGLLGSSIYYVTCGRWVRGGGVGVGTPLLIRCTQSVEMRIVGTDWILFDGNQRRIVPIPLGRWSSLLLSGGSRIYGVNFLLW